MTDAAIIMAPVWQTGLRLRFRDKFTVAQVSMSTNEKAGYPVTKFLICGRFITFLAILTCKQAKRVTGDKSEGCALSR